MRRNCIESNSTDTNLTPILCKKTLDYSLRNSRMQFLSTVNLKWKKAKYTGSSQYAFQEMMINTRIPAVENTSKVWENKWNCQGKHTEWKRPAWPGTIVTICMSCFMTGDPDKEYGTNKPPPTWRVWERSKGHTACQSTSQNPSR